MAENNLQQWAICYATGALRAHFRDRPDVHVRGDRGDMFIYYYRNGQPTKSTVPDVFVVVGDVGVPQFIMEVASESTDLRGRDDKAEVYEGLGV